ncbi:recombinase family protein [Azohydromonas aeria]|uniref:recombinase family protein n=1 Tax=Azohydromonas aeria TaxID=2590212 RepID=UPI0012F8906C|nr:recombinase family protein [Azohydromonas aeria]
MSRTFCYCRVSTENQTTDNQVKEIREAGFAIEPHRIVCETVSGSQAAAKRPGFKKLVEKLEPGDVLVVTKLDRLGRSALDVRATVDMLAANKVRVHCLALGGVDLTSAAGKMTMQVIAAVAEFELDLLKERTKAGLDRAKAEGKKLGRRSSLSEGDIAEVRTLIKQPGQTVSGLAKKYEVSRATILRAAGQL